MKTAADPTGGVWREPSANCSGSVTPWGTVLSGEENFHSYFVADSNAFGSDRYGLNGRPSVCGDSDESGRYFGGWQGPVAPISCPDNLTFDSVGNLWIATDGAPGSISKADGLFRVPVEGAERGRVVQFLAVPYQAETCGPVIDDRDGSVFVAVQHPGEEGSWDEQLSYFPDYVPARVRPRPGAWRGPRSSVIQVTRRG